MLSEVPEGWQISTLGEVCNPKQHPTIQKTKLTSEGYPVYGANGQIGFFSDYTHEDRTLAITCRGATCGTINVVPPKSYITGNAMALDSLDESAVAFDFLNHYLRHFGVDACITGSAQPQITRSSLLPVELALPPLNEQHCIAEILSSVDASIQATQAVIEQAERVKRGLMEELLTGGLGSEVVERGELPEGWQISPLGEIAKITTGKTPSTKQEEFWCGGIPFVTPSDLDGSLFVKETERSLTAAGAEKSKLIPAGSLMFTCIASIGKAAISETECVTNQQINACTFASPEETLFYHFQLQHRLNELLALAGQTAVAIINKGKFSSFSVFVPPLSELSRIAQILLHFDEFIAKQKLIVEQNVRTKRGLMDDLLTGKVRTV